MYEVYGNFQRIVSENYHIVYWGNSACCVYIAFWQHLLLDFNNHILLPLPNEYNCAV